MPQLDIVLIFSTETSSLANMLCIILEVTTQGCRGAFPDKSCCCQGSDENMLAKCNSQCLLLNLYGEVDSDCFPSETLMKTKCESKQIPEMKSS